MRGLDLRSGNRSRRRAVQCVLALLCVGVLVALFLGRGVLFAQASALPRQLDSTLAEHFVPEYTARLDALAEENFKLRTALAAAQPALQQSDELRTLLGAGRVSGRVVYAPARLTMWYGDRFTLVCSGDSPAPCGTPVFDRYGRFAGLVTRTDRAKNAAGEYTAHCDAAGCGNAALPCFAGGENAVCGTLARRRDGLYLISLPRHSGLAAGDIVVTASGLWVGRLGEAPKVDSGGLNAAAPLYETAVTAGDVYFPAE